MTRPPEAFVFIIGGPKCGTTSLAHWLNSRPDMAYCAGKEPRFFTDFASIDWSGPGAGIFRESMVTDEETYLAGFPSEGDVRWAIDGSTDYMWCAVSAGRIRAWANRFPSKLICVLRDPIDRALSEYRHTLRDGLESKSFRQSLEEEEARFSKNWQPLFYHRRRSLYLESVARYAELFGEDLLILDYHELKKPSACLKKVEAFLGVAPMNTASSERQNVSHSYRYPFVGRMLGNPALQRFARMLTPKSVRHRIREGIVSATATGFEPASEVDRKLIADLLADEISACRASPLIPTQSWKTADQFVS